MSNSVCILIFSVTRVLDFSELATSTPWVIADHSYCWVFNGKMTEDWWTLFFRNPAPEKKEQLFPDDKSSIGKRYILHYIHDHSFFRFTRFISLFPSKFLSGLISRHKETIWYSSFKNRWQYHAWVRESIRLMTSLRQRDLCISVSLQVGSSHSQSHRSSPCQTCKITGQ